MCPPVHYYAGKAVAAAADPKPAPRRRKVDPKPTSCFPSSPPSSNSSYSSTPDYTPAIVPAFDFGSFDTVSSISSDFGSSWGDGGFSGGGGGDFGGGGSSGDW